MRLLIAINQFFCHLLTGQSDLTLSAWSYLAAETKQRTWPKKLIDSLFFWQVGHCQEAFKQEYRGRLQFIEQYGQLYHR